MAALGAGGFGVWFALASSYPVPAPSYLVFGGGGVCGAGGGSVYLDNLYTIMLLYLY